MAPHFVGDRSGRFVRISRDEAASREAVGLHVDWAEGVGWHYFPAYDPPASGIEARSDETRSGSAEGESPAREAGDAP